MANNLSVSDTPVPVQALLSPLDGANHGGDQPEWSHLHLMTHRLSHLPLITDQPPF